MTIQQEKTTYLDKEHVECPITERLVKGGYQQASGGLPCVWSPLAKCIPGIRRRFYLGLVNTEKG